MCFAIANLDQISYWFLYELGITERKTRNPSTGMIRTILWQSPRAESNARDSRMALEWGRFTGDGWAPLLHSDITTSISDLHNMWQRKRNHIICSSRTRIMENWMCTSRVRTRFPNVFYDFFPLIDFDFRLLHIRVYNFKFNHSTKLVHCVMYFALCLLYSLK